MEIFQLTSHSLHQSPKLVRTRPMRVHPPSRFRASNVRVSTAQQPRTRHHRWKNSAARPSTSWRRPSTPRSSNTSTGTKAGRTGHGSPSLLLPSQQKSDQSGDSYLHHREHRTPHRHLRCLQKARRRMATPRCQMYQPHRRHRKNHRSERVLLQIRRLSSGQCLARGRKTRHPLTRQ